LAKCDVKYSTKIVLDIAEETIRVLHVDDDKDILKVSKQCLEIQGDFLVESASSVDDALQKLKANRFDAIVADYQMPQKDGLVLLKELRQNGDNVPFIVFTGKGREEVAIRSLNLGADQYLNKTGEPESVYCELAHSIRNAVKNRQAFDQREKTLSMLRATLDSTNDGLLVVGNEGKILLVNPRFREMWKIPESLKDSRDTQTALPFIMDHVKDPEIFMKRVKELTINSDSDGHDVIELKDGRVFERYTRPLVIRGLVTGRVWSFHDTTKRILAQAELEQREQIDRSIEKSEEQYKSFVQLAPDGIITMNLDGIITSVNPALLSATGYSESEIITKHFTEVPWGIIDEEKPRFLELFMRLAQGEVHEKVEFHYEDKGGVPHWAEAGVALQTTDGKPVGIYAIIRDVTKRKQMEEALRESEEKYRRQFDEALDAIFLADAETGILLDCNRAAAELVAREKSELIGKHQRILHPPEEITGEFSTSFKQHLKENEGQVLETHIITKNGEIKDVAIKANVLRLKNKAILQGIFRDITERKKDEQAIKESQQKFEGLFRHNPEAAVYLDLNFKILDVNPHFCQLFGYSAEEVKGRNINDAVAPESLREEAEGLDKDAKNGYARHNTVRKRKDGSLVHVSISAAPVTFEDKLLGYVGIYKDITDLKKAQEESEESRRHFQTLFNLMADPVVIVDRIGKILEATQRVEDVTGFKREELVGKNFLKTKIATAKTKAIMIKNLAKRIMGMHVQPYEVEILRKDGGKLMYEINATRIDYQGGPADLVVFRDIAERKKLEEKLRVVGSLTRHDVRNKLSAVTGNAYLLRRKLAGKPEALEHLADIEAAIRKVETIFEFARTYEKLGVEQLISMNVGKAVDEAASLFTDLKGVKIVNECHDLTVLTDSLLRQLFYNLIDNTLKYGEKTGQIRIYSKKPSADKLELVYEDDGVGIPDNVRSNLFKEGLTSGKGSGYGLFMIKRICQVYGWTIRETGKQGKGAQFTMTIPKIDNAGKADYQA
jgi:PAS domain S-box-containing protein